MLGQIRISLMWRGYPHLGTSSLWNPYGHQRGRGVRHDAYRSFFLCSLPRYLLTLGCVSDFDEDNHSFMLCMYYALLLLHHLLIYLSNHRTYPLTAYVQHYPPLLSIPLCIYVIPSGIFLSVACCISLPTSQVVKKQTVVTNWI